MRQVTRVSSVRNKSQRALTLIMSALLVPFAMLMRCLRPWIFIRVGYFTADRIGHFAFDLGYYIAERGEQSKSSRSLDLFFLEGTPANKQLAKMCRREVNVSPIFKVLFMASQWLPDSDRHAVVPSRELTASRDKSGLLARSEEQLKFLPEEDLMGQAFLQKIGCDDVSKVVCLIVRDSAYLSETQVGRDWSYHNFRDTSIDSYAGVACALADKGYWVLRMGKVVNQSFKVNHDRVLDYANTSDRSDFLDIWLMANCSFVISTGLGLDSVADIFRRPQVFVNYLPLIDLEAWGQYLTVPKHLFWEKTLRPLTFAEHLQHSSLNGHSYAQAGILIKDLSSEEVTEAVIEFEERLTGAHVSLEEDDHLQRRFWCALKESGKFDKYHGWIHPQARVGKDFLKRTQDYFFD
jgi:putative glycosyltransferase (TIGR04372 family)